VGCPRPPEYLITWAEPRHVLADRFNLPRHIAPQNGGFPWFAQSVDHAHEVRQAAHEVPVSGIDGSCADPYQHLIVSDHRFVDLRKF
jgi:hypothetical protein